MSHPKSLDTAGTITAVVLAAILIGVSLPFTLALWGGEGDQEIAWATTVYGSQDATLTGDGAEGQARVTVTDALTAQVWLHGGACDDTYNGQAGQNPASIHWAVIKVQGTTTTTLDEGDVACADLEDLGIVIGVTEVPDVDTVAAGEDATAAYAKVSSQNETAEYHLEFSSSRAPGTVPPLPIPGNPLSTTVTATMTLEIQVWTPTIVESPEVVR